MYLSTSNVLVRRWSGPLSQGKVQGQTGPSSWANEILRTPYPPFQVGMSTGLDGSSDCRIGACKNAERVIRCVYLSVYALMLLPHPLSSLQRTCCSFNTIPAEEVLRRCLQRGDWDGASPLSVEACRRHK